jgi:Flp pilus assembly protein protease CpaA
MWTAVVAAGQLNGATFASLPLAPVVSWGVVIAACAFATVVDVRSRRIPNKLTFPLLLGGAAWSLLTHGILGGLAEALLGMAIAGLPFVVLWMMGTSGAGDAKMMLAVGAWLGAHDAFIGVLAVALAGGVLSIAYAVRHRRLLFAALRDRRKIPVKTPYSIAILVGTCAAATWVFACAA